VDMVAGTIMEALAGCRRATDPAAAQQPDPRIRHATVDSSQADWIPSFRTLMVRLFQILALRRDLSLPEGGLLLRLLTWSDNETAFWLLDIVANRAPNAILSLLCTVAYCIAFAVGLRSDEWKERCKNIRMLSRYSHLPMQYAPFSSPSSAWQFKSSLRLPADWDPAEYSSLIVRAAVAFAAAASKGGSGAAASTAARAAEASFAELRVVAPRGVVQEALLTFSMPGAPLFQCTAAFLIRRVLQWMDLTVTVNASDLNSLTHLSAPLVLCPTHRSLLDFVIIGAACFELRPQVPTLKLPHVAADAEFSGLPFLGRALSALGAFFVRRGGGAVQPDPALRAEVGRVFRNGRPLEVFLEGLRSRGRRHLRLRTGLLRALRDVAQRSVALVPVALSYELLPEDQSFFDELRGLPRPPLRTLGLVSWVLKGVRGELPSYGDVHVRLGATRVLDASSDLRALLSQVQAELVGLTALSTLHARALAEVLELPAGDVLQATRSAGLRLRPSRLDGWGVKLSEAQRWALALQMAILLRDQLPQQWALWLVEPVFGRTSAPSQRPLSDDESQKSGPEVAAEKDPGALDIAAVARALAAMLEAAEEAGHNAAKQMREGGITAVSEEHLAQQLLDTQDGRGGLPPPLARGAACIVAGALSPVAPATGYDAPPSSGAAGGGGATADGAKPRTVEPIWPAAAQGRGAERRVDTEALDRWGFSDTRFAAQWVDGKPAVQVTSKRYSALGGQPLYQLWAFFQRELAVSMNVRDTLPEQPLPEVPQEPEDLRKQLEAAVPAERVVWDAEARLRAGTGHGLADIWRLRTREADRRMPDAVVQPSSEGEVLAVLQAAAAAAGEEAGGFAVIPVGGRTNVTSATQCPGRAEDPRPFVALDMRGLSKVLWVNAEDGVAHIEAGITGVALKKALAKHGVTMGMEPDSMEFSTLGGWIATRASGMKRARYGNIEEMIVETRVATPTGLLWQRNGGATSSSSCPGTAFGRVSAGPALPGLVLGSEGCLGVVTSAVVRVKPLPEVVEYQSVVFQDWAAGAAWMREVARLPAAVRPASCRLMDSKQLGLSRAIREGSGGHGPVRAALQGIALRLRGVSLGEASAATLLFEGSRAEVAVQKRLLAQLVSRMGGVWGGASSGEAGYALTFAIAYLRDFGLDYRILSESLETMAPWSAIGKVWPAVVAAVRAEHRALRLPGQPFLSCRMTQLYDEGGVLYMYLAVSTAGLGTERALEAFERLEHAARRAVLAAGGCLSHHHGVGKLRAELLKDSQSPELIAALRGLKSTMDPGNVLAARNGAWAAAALSSTVSNTGEQEPPAPAKELGY